MPDREPLVDRVRAEYERRRQEREDRTRRQLAGEEAPPVTRPGDPPLVTRPHDWPGDEQPPVMVCRSVGQVEADLRLLRRVAAALSVKHGDRQLAADVDLLGDALNEAISAARYG
jgi:hypothetical protein